MFSKNISTPITIIKSRNIYACATCDHFFIHTICKYLDMASLGNLHIEDTPRKMGSEHDVMNVVT